MRLSSGSLPQLTVLVSLITASHPIAAQQQIHELTASDASSGDGFGDSVAISGAMAVVGATGHDLGGLEAGAAYLFDAWTGAEIFRLLPSDAGAYYRFGISAGVDGDRVVVGADRNSTTAFQSGAAYLFDTGTGMQVARIEASNGWVEDHFGWDVAISGDRVIVGAFLADCPLINSGCAYIFDTLGNELFELVPSDSKANGLVGFSVDIDGDRAVVGGLFSDGVANMSGSAYVFDVTTGAELFELIPNSGASMDSFGQSVAISGDRAVIGTNADRTSAYVFDVTTGQQLHRLRHPGVKGVRVAVSGDRALLLNDGQTAMPMFDVNTGQLIAELSASSGDPLGKDVAMSPHLMIAGKEYYGSAFVFGDWADCNGNGIPDDQDLAAGTSQDCNNNEVPDECDIAEGFSLDDNSNGIPDECESIAEYCTCPTGVCGNQDPDAGCANSAGHGARLYFTGTSGVAADDLSLHTAQLPPNRSVMTYMGETGILAPFGDGLRCVGGRVYRYAVDHSGADGAITLGPGVVSLSWSSFGSGGRIVPGSTWYFQSYYRDGNGPCGTGFNLSSAIQVDFLP